MIVVNKPNNFYWEYNCYFEQGAASVNITYSNNSTLGTITANRSALGKANFTITPALFTTNKTYVSFTYSLTNSNLCVFEINTSTSSVEIYQKNGVTGVDGFSGWLSIRIYP